jgi:hypothetical protein
VLEHEQGRRPSWAAFRGLSSISISPVETRAASLAAHRRGCEADKETFSGKAWADARSSRIKSSSRRELIGSSPADGSSKNWM